MTTKLSMKDKAIQYGINDNKVIDRFKSKLILQESGCVEYQSAMWDYRDRYRPFEITIKVDGQKRGTSVKVKAHRFAYALAHGFNKLPVGTDTTQKRNVLHHKCENKSCVNPLHLEPVSDRWNLGRVNDKNMF